MRSPVLFALLAVLLALPLGCEKPPPPPPPAEEAAVDEEPPEDTGELGQFLKSKKKQRARKRTKASMPPTRQQGLEALEEGRMLIEEAEFVAAERELRIAAAAGVEDGDRLLLRVRNELAAEKLILSAQKKLAANDVGGARADLQRVPAGLILSDYARQTLEKIAARESDARKELLEKVNRRIADSGDAGEAAQAAPATPAAAPAPSPAPDPPPAGASDSPAR